MALALDEKNEGLAQAWFTRTLPGAIHLPGSVDEAAVVDNSEPPTLMRLYRPHQYTGAAWYQRTIEVPAALNGRHLWLSLERCHWETRVWVDHVPLGMQDTLCVPHEYDLGPLSPGPHRLTIRVDNRLKYNMGWQSLGPNLLAWAATCFPRTRRPIGTESWAASNWSKCPPSGLPTCKSIPTW